MPNETEEESNIDLDSPVEETAPLEVKIVEQKKEISVYDSKDDDNYIDDKITDEQIKEFENGSNT